MANPRKATRPSKSTFPYKVRWTKAMWEQLSGLEANRAVNARAEELMKTKPLGPFMTHGAAKEIAVRQIGVEMGGSVKKPFEGYPVRKKAYRVLPGVSI